MEAGVGKLLGMDNEDINDWALDAMRQMLRRVFRAIALGEWL